METGLYNITSATTTTLIDILEDRGGIKSINIANCNASNIVTVTLFLDDGTNQTSYIENVVIPVGSSLMLNEGMSFNNNVLALKLTTAGTSPDVNVIIK
tara:strand:- start:39 stop:335 length:297 start_codon:yes stop_codon:yes gene_type:complete